MVNNINYLLIIWNLILLLIFIINSDIKLISFFISNSKNQRCDNRILIIEVSGRGANVFQFDQIVFVGYLILGKSKNWKQSNNTPVIHK